MLSKNKGGRYVWAAILLLLCPVAKAQSDSAAVATDTTDVYKNVGLGELTVKPEVAKARSQ